MRICTLKARQQGLSTVISAFQYFCLSQHTAKKGIVIAHKSDSARALFDMYKRMHTLMPKMLKQSTSTVRARNWCSINSIPVSLSRLLVVKVFPR